MMSFQEVDCRLVRLGTPSSIVSGQPIVSSDASTPLIFVTGFGESRRSAKLRRDGDGHG